ncbi:MAG: ornithine cyclodeaminase family protein [Pyrodictiaceae archaeon]
MARILGGEDVERLVDPAELVKDVEMVLKSDAHAPPRQALEHQGSWFGVMPAAGLGYYAVKLVGVYPSNPRRGLPLVRGTLLLFDAGSGELLLEADAGPATGWRTAAATALALRLLGYQGGGVLGVIGAGVQADYHTRMIKLLYQPDNIIVYDIDHARARRFAEKHGGRTVGLEELHSESDLLVAATTSTSPVVKGALLRRGAYVASIGAPRPVRELDDEAKKRARCILVDTIEGARRETDDVEGVEELVELRQVVRGEKACSPGEIRVYKSVGTALLDLAIAIHLYRRL